MTESTPSEPSEQWLYPSRLDRPFCPEQLGIDYQWVCDVTAEYAVRVVSTAYFSRAGLRDYLENLEHHSVWLPEDDEEWHALFSKMQKTIEQRIREAGAKYRWVEDEVDGETKYALARWIPLAEFNALGAKAVKAASPAAPPAAKPAKSTPASPKLPAPAKQEPKPVASHSRQQPQMADRKYGPVHQRPAVAESASVVAADVLNGIFDDTPQRLRMRDFAPLAARLLGVPRRSAEGIIRDAAQTGLLSKHTQGGNVWYGSRDAALDKDKVPVQGRQAERKNGRPLNPQEQVVAESVLDSLSRQDLDVKRGRTIRQLEQAVAGSLPERQFRKLLRAMQGVGLLDIAKVVRARKGRRPSPKVQITQELKTDWNNDNRAKYLELLGEAEIV
jgi:hypothetical protein